MVYLQKTKMEEINMTVVRRLWGSPFVDWEFQAAEGASGDDVGQTSGGKNRCCKMRFFSVL